MGNSGDQIRGENRDRGHGRRICSRGRQERLWYEGWQADYEAAASAGDDDAREMLLDVLVAFDAFEAAKRPTRLRRVA